MVELIALVKGTFRKFQLQAEVAVMDHDIAKRQKAFGIELFDLIEKQRIDMRHTIEETLKEGEEKDEAELKPRPSDAIKPEAIESLLKVFQTIENEIRGPLQSCKDDVDRMTEANYLPLLIQKRKEAFGVEVWPIVSEPKWLHETLECDLKKALAAEEKSTKDKANTNTKNTNTNTETSATTAKSTKDDPLGKFVNAAIKGVVKGTKTTITKVIGKLSPEQRAVEDMVNNAKNDIAVVEAQKSEKMTEISELVQGGTTLECC
mmetsp:Transcript_18829/g.38769  ORF Transcript_18829/g.38769 Transcript_18829/m.38769 type:complete len:262 (+) Transcript_18829:97-882(+)